MNLGLVAHIGKQAITGGAKVAGVVSRHAPEILLGIGLVGGAATTVGAVRATLKCEEAMAAAQEDYQKINDAMDILSREQYTAAEVEGDIKQVHGVFIGNMIRNIVPVVILGGVSVVSILCGYNIINRRYTAVIAAYGALESSFKLYRYRVIAEQGEEADQRYLTGSTTKKIDREVVDPETGEVKNKKMKCEVIEEGVKPINYQINFCREAVHIPDSRDIVHSLDFIISVENSLNTQLKAFRYVTLNDARRCLGVPATSYGQIVGWTLDGDGDCYIALNPRTVYDEELGEDTIMIDPNVDGIIFNKIDAINEVEYA